MSFQPSWYANPVSRSLSRRPNPLDPGEPATLTLPYPPGSAGGRAAR